MLSNDKNEAKSTSHYLYQQMIPVQESQDRVVMDEKIEAVL